MGTIYKADDVSTRVIINIAVANGCDYAAQWALDAHTALMTDTHGAGQWVINRTHGPVRGSCEITHIFGDSVITHWVPDALTDAVRDEHGAGQWVSTYDESDEETILLVWETTPTHDIIEFCILECFACYIAYGDAGDLSEAETDAFDATERDLVESHGTGHWSIDTDYDEQYGRCEITGIFGRLIKATYVVMAGGVA